MGSRIAVVMLLAACSYKAPAQVGDAATDTPPTDSVDMSTTPVQSPRRLTYGMVAVGADVDDAQLLVTLDATKIDYAAVTTPATDLRFHDEGSNADLPFEIERWDPAGKSLVWVRVPVVPRDTKTSILMFFGADAAGTENATAVWPGYEAVHHFTTGLASSTNTHDATAVNTTLADAQIGSGVAFDGTGDERVTFANGNDLFDAYSAFTIELWLYPDYADGTALPGEPKIMDKGTSLTIGRLFPSGAQIRFQVDLHFTNSNDMTVNTAVTGQAWSYLAYVFDGDNRLRLYRDGVQQNVGNLQNNGNSLLVSAQSYFLGDSTAPFHGMIDELRIQQAPVSTDFLVVQNLSMRDQLITFGDP